MTISNPYCQGPTLFEWMPDVDLNLGMPSRHIPQGRSYTNVVFEPTSGLLVAASLVESQFSSYDEEGTEMWSPDSRFFLCLVYFEVLRRLLSS
jgi:cleavage and polyadenylation specificity factor subunit 1